MEIKDRVAIIQVMQLSKSLRMQYDVSKQTKTPNQKQTKENKITIPVNAENSCNMTYTLYFGCSIVVTLI